jgi:DNA (cytosine-5)-methyltransferase 1
MKNDNQLLPVSERQLPPDWWKVFEPKRGAREVIGFDGWCGMGVGTMSIINSCLQRGWRLKKITAVNHWTEAIKIHAANYPQAAHFCDKMENLSPLALVPSGHLDIFTAGIKCQPFSQAAGGIERNEQERMDFYQVLRYATDLDIPTIVLENVAGFMDWGPLNQQGRPIERLRGTLFNQGIEMLRALQYNVEWKLLTACWYGDPTSRERLWIIAKKKGSGRKVFFPVPTHRDPNKPADMFNASQPTWPVARDIIDWSLPTKSIFGDTLVPNTLSRILAGADKFAGLRLEFSALPGCPPMPKKVLQKGARLSPYAQSAWNLHYLNCALRVANGLKLNQKNTKLIKRVNPKDVKLVKRLQNCEPRVMQEDAQYMIKLYGTNVTASLADALPTVTGSNHLGMVMINRGAGDGYERNTPLNETVPTLTQSPAASLVDFSFLMSGEHVGRGDDRVASIDREMPTLTRTPDWSMTETQFIVGREHAGNGKDNIRHVDREFPTLTTKPDWSVAAAFLSVYHGERDGLSSIDAALPVVDTSNRFLAAYITQYNGTNVYGQDVDVPLHTVPTRDRFMLVIPGQGYMDIRTRLLVLDELRKAHSIPDDFKFGPVSIENAKKMVGNSWALKMGTAVMDAALS